MAHSFVIAKLVPQRSAFWTSHYGIQKAAALVTRPFLALRVFATDIGLGDPSEPGLYTFLFVVSPEKPTGINRDCYFTVPPTPTNSKRVLFASPPFPSEGCPLYIHTFPKIAEVRPRVATNQIPTIPHRLDDSSFRAFCRSVMEDHSQRMRLQQLEVDKPSSGGADSVGDGWDTWSGQPSTENLNDPDGCVYEHLQLKNLPLQETPTIYQELLLYKQLTADYSWPGVTAAISWVKKLRDYTAKHTLPQVQLSNPDYPYTGSMPEFRPELRVSSDALQSMQIPFDGDPPPVVEEDQEWEWDDPSPGFSVIYDAVPPVSAVDVKVIVFDLFGTIFDRETAIREAVLQVAQFDRDNHKPHQLLELYMECEAHTIKDHPEAPYVDTARSALKDVATRLGASVSDMALEKGLKHLLRPRLYADAIPAINTLRARGFALLGLSPYDTATFSQYVQPFLPTAVTVVHPPPASNHLCSQSPSLFPEVLNHSRCVHGEIKTVQILVVTAAPYRVVEAANEAGFPAALLRRADALEAKIEIPGAAPTFMIHDLAHLNAELDISTSLQPRIASKFEVPFGFAPFRIRNLYQIYKSLGMGSFGNVFGAFNLLTGQEVAIKVEVPTDKPDERCVLPYEARVYRQLQGHQGIPSLRWFGKDCRAHVIVLDRLGPTLQQLRKFCRGQLSLKTVLMVAEQMLTRIEFAHSRGIILRDIKPENFAMGMGDHLNLVHLFDFGLAKFFVNPATNEHIPFRVGRVGLGTPRYASHNVHFGREQSRRDDIEALGNVLLFLLHGRLPWQGIYAPSIEAKLLRIGEMKAGSVFQDLLARSPPEFTRYFDHCRNLAFQEKPDYVLLKGTFRKRMEEEHWVYDGAFDWVHRKSSKGGTLLPEEYKFDSKFVEHDLDW